MTFFELTTSRRCVCITYCIISYIIYYYFSKKKKKMKCIALSIYIGFHNLQCKFLLHYHISKVDKFRTNTNCSDRVDRYGVKRRDRTRRCFRLVHVTQDEWHGRVETFRKLEKFRLESNSRPRRCSVRGYWQDKLYLCYVSIA